MLEIATPLSPQSPPAPAAHSRAAVRTPGSAQRANSPKVPLSPAAQGLRDPEVFLLSMFDLGKYDFRLLEESMVRDLESQKRHAFLVALPNVS